MSTTTNYNQQAIDFLTSTNTVLKFSHDGFKKYWDDDKQKRNVFTWTLTRGDKSITGKFGSSIADSCKATPKLQSNESIEVYAGLSIKFKHPKANTIYFGYKMNTNCNVLAGIAKEEIVVDSIIDMTVLEYEYNDFVRRHDEYRKKHKLGKETLKGILSDIHSVKNYVEKRIYAKIEELKGETVLLDQADNIITPSEYDLLACLTKYDPGTFENFCADFGYDTDSRKAEKTYKEVLKEWENLSSLFTSEEMELLAEIN